MSDQLHQPVMVAVIIMWLMELSIYQVVDVITMRNGFVPTAWTMLVARALNFSCATHGVVGAYRDHVFINVTPVHVVKMALMKVVQMTVMANCLVSTIRTVLVDMVGMVLLGTCGHASLLLH